MDKSKVVLFALFEMNQTYANCLIRNNENALADKISKKILQENPDNAEILKVSAISSPSSIAEEISFSISSCGR